MFSDFLRRLTAPAPDPLDDGDARLALAALLVRLARADGDYAPAEIDRIDRILVRRHGLSPFEVADLRTRAETLEHEAPDTVRFTRAIKAAVPLEDRRGVLVALWQVALADGLRDDHEDSAMRVIAQLLGISDHDNALARQQAQG